MRITLEVLADSGFICTKHLYSVIKFEIMHKIQSRSVYVLVFFPNPTVDLAALFLETALAVCLAVLEFPPKNEIVIQVNGANAVSSPLLELSLIFYPTVS